MLATTKPVGLSAFTALRATSAAQLLAVAGQALDQTLELAPEARTATLLIFSGARFTGPRQNEPENPSDGALLDNLYATRLVGELLLERGMTAAQAHGVLFADESPLLSALRAARSFIVAEELEHLLVVAVEPPCVAASLLVSASASDAAVTLSKLSASGGISAAVDLMSNIEALRGLARRRAHERLTLAEGGWCAELSTNPPRLSNAAQAEAR
jgi:hypothetical protein